MERINLTAMAICIKNSHLELMQIRLEKILELLPSGSGIDSGIQFDEDKSNPNKLIFRFGFHHMNSDGYYDGWTEHKLVILPEFGSFDLRITGRDRNHIKEYLYDMFFELFEVTDGQTAQEYLNSILNWKEYQETK
jgi:hypothetical protein